MAKRGSTTKRRRPPTRTVLAIARPADGTVVLRRGSARLLRLWLLAGVAAFGVVVATSGTAAPSASGPALVALAVAAGVLEQRRAVVLGRRGVASRGRLHTGSLRWEQLRSVEVTPGRWPREVVELVAVDGRRLRLGAVDGGLLVGRRATPRLAAAVVSEEWARARSEALLWPGRPGS